MFLLSNEVVLLAEGKSVRTFMSFSSANICLMLSFLSVTMFKSVALWWWHPLSGLPHHHIQFYHLGTF